MAIKKEYEPKLEARSAHETDSDLKHEHESGTEPADEPIEFSASPLAMGAFATPKDFKGHTAFSEDDVQHIS